MLIRNENGQSLVELGISFVFLMYLLSGAVEFGIIFFQYVQLRDAAQEGALYGSACKTCSAVDIEDRVRGSSATPIDLSDDSVSISITPNSGWCEGDGMEVQVSYPHKIFMPFMPKIVGREYIQLNASVTNTVLTPVCR